MLATNKPIIQFSFFSKITQGLNLYIQYRLFLNKITISQIQTF